MMDLLRTLIESAKREKSNIFWGLFWTLAPNYKRIGNWAGNILDAIMVTFLFYLAFVHSDLIQFKEILIRLGEWLVITPILVVVILRLKLHNVGAFKLSETILIKLFIMVLMIAIIRILPKLKFEPQVADLNLLGPGKEQ